MSGLFSGLFDSTTTNTPSPQAQAQLSDAWTQVDNASQAPYTPYTGQQVAPLNTGQLTAIGQLQGTYGLATPWLNSAAPQYNNAAASLGNVNNYLQSSSDALAGVGKYQNVASSALGQGTSISAEPLSMRRHKRSTTRRT